MSHAEFDEHYHTRDLHTASGGEFARLVGEICERLVELRELDSDKANRWLSRICAIRTLPHGDACLAWYLHMQTGDMAALTVSMRDVGGRHCRSKQAVQQELERASSEISSAFPEMAAAIHELRRSLKDYVGEGAGRG